MEKEITLCGKHIKLGDQVLVILNSGNTLNGAITSGTVVELWDSFEGQPRARLDNGWSFNDEDIVLEHIVKTI